MTHVCTTEPTDSLLPKQNAIARSRYLTGERLPVCRLGSRAAKPAALFVVTLALAAGLWLSTSWILAGGTPLAAALPRTEGGMEYLPAQAQQGIYVVTFQEGSSPAGYNGAADANLNYFAPTDNQGGHAELIFRSDGWQRALLRFDLSQHIPSGVRVISATLTLHVQSQSVASPMRLVAYPVLQEWVESEVTWNEAQHGIAWVGGGGCEGSSRSAIAAGSTILDQPSGDVVLDLTSAVQAWVDDATANQGVLLTGETVAGSVTYRVVSSDHLTLEYRPGLRVMYEGAPPLATPTPTQTPTKTPTPSDFTMLTSTLSDWKYDLCLKVDSEVNVAEEQMLLIWQGNPWAAELRVAVCNTSYAHPIFLNGVQIGTTEFPVQGCECNDTFPGAYTGYMMTIPIDPALVKSGPTYSNVITVSNEARPYDGFKAFGAQLILFGDITGTTRSYFTVSTDYDGSAIQGAMQLPIGYNPNAATPLLISIPGTDEDKDDGLIRHMVGANQMGWLLASLDMRRSRPSESAKDARTPSLAVQRDIMNLVQYMETHYNVDPTRIYIAGFSTGGGIAATVAAKYPDVFAGVLDYAGPTDYAEWYSERADLAIELGGEFGGDPTNNFEYPRRSSRFLARNLEYVPMRIVHGTSDDRVPSTQSTRLYTDTMPLFYDRAATFKELYLHPDGHTDHVAGISETDLQFLSQHTLVANPQHLSIITDEAKDYYWLRVDKMDASPDAWSGAVEVSARYDAITSTIWVTAKDADFAEGRALTVTLNLSKMGLNAAGSYDVEEFDPQTGDFFFHAATSPAGGKLALSVPRDALGSVNRRFVIYPASGRTPTTLRMQQGVDGYTGAKDTYITNIGSEGSTEPHGSVDRLLVAYDLRRKALLQFDLSSVPAGKVLKAAKLTVNLLETRSSSISLGAYEAKRLWLDTEATWERATQSQLWAVAGGDGVGTDRADVATYAVNNVGLARSYTFDVKPLVEQWIGTTASNLGLFLIGNGPYTTDSYALASSEYADLGKRPLLEIWYMDPMPTPTATSSALATRTPTVTRTGTPTPTRTATTVQTTGTATRTGTATSTPTATNTPTLTSSRTPTATTTRTPTQTPTPTQLLVPTVVSSTASDCMEIVADGKTVQSAEAKMLLLWEGTPVTASLVLNSCGVKTDRNHSIYLNGQRVAQVESDVFSACNCFVGGRTVTYTLSSPSIVISGWNIISITNDADVTDDWLAYGARLSLAGNLASSTIGEITFTSRYDQTTRHALYQLPVGYRLGAASQSAGLPVLVSIGGVGETKWDAVYRFAEDANAHGWIILAPDIRWVAEPEQGRTASLAVQHDIIDAIDYLLASPAFNADPNRIYMSGFSVGGGIAATVAAKYPQRFAAVVDWAGPTDLHEWSEQRPEMEVKFPLIRDIGCAYDGGADPCPFEWTRRSARSMTQNLKHVPMAVVHGRNDTKVPFAQSSDFIAQMRNYFVPEDNNKLFFQHDGDHVDVWPGFSTLDFMAPFTLTANPSDIMIRADENKDYYWVQVVQKDWNGNWANGFSSIVASYDLASRVISATITDERGFRDGNLPVDVGFDLSAMGFDPSALYSIEDFDVAQGIFVLSTGVAPKDGRIWVSVPRDDLGKVVHQYLIYPFAAPTLHTVSFQQGVSPGSTYDGATDTYIYQYQPATNYGRDVELIVNNGGSLASLLRFDISTIPLNAVIKEARLTLDLTNQPSNTLEVSLYALKQHWVDTQANWNQAAEGIPWAVPGVNGAGVDYDPTPVGMLDVQGRASYSFNVKSLVQQWLTHAVPNEGLLVVGPRLGGGSGAEYYRFASSEGLDVARRPRLEIAYMLPSITPTPTASPTATPTRTSVPTATATPTRVSSPTATHTPTSIVPPTATPTVTATPEFCTLQGSVTLQRPGQPAPDASWSVTLTVTIDGKQHVATTDTSGNFTLAGLTPGTHEVRVKNSHTLANRRTVSLVLGTNTVSFGTLKEGDANDDNCVTMADFSILAAAFFPSYDAQADFNQDGYVNLRDFIMLRENFALCGDIEVTGP
jgi:predicted peptidase